VNETMKHTRKIWANHCTASISSLFSNIPVSLTHSYLCCSDLRLVVFKTNNRCWW